MRGSAIGFLFLIVGLSACVGTTPEIPLPSAGDDMERSTVAWGLTNCRFIIATIRPSEEVVRRYLPEGFEPVLGDGLPLPVEAPVANAVGGIEAFACERGAGLSGDVAPLAYGSFYFVVDPPEEYDGGDDFGHYVKHDVLIPDEPRRALLESVGAPVVAGDVQVVDTAAGRDAVMMLDGIGEVRYTATLSQTGRAFEDFPFREFTPTDDGRLLLWDAVAATPGTFSGQGILEVPDGSTLATLAGGPRVELPMFWGTYTFSNATTTLP